MAAKVTAPKPAAKRAAQQSIRGRLGPPPTGAPQDGQGGPLDAGVQEFEPVRLVPLDPADVPQIPLFLVGDKTYTVPAQPGIEVGLEANRIMARLSMAGASTQQAEGAVMDYILGEMLGEEGYAALRSFRGLKAEDFAKITEIAYRLTLGALEVPKAAGSG